MVIRDDASNGEGCCCGVWQENQAPVSVFGSADTSNNDKPGTSSVGVSFCDANKTLFDPSYPSNNNLFETSLQSSNSNKEVPSKPNLLGNYSMFTSMPATNTQQFSWKPPLLNENNTTSTPPSTPPVTNTQQLSWKPPFLNDNNTTSTHPLTPPVTNTQQSSSNPFVRNENKTTSPLPSTLPATNNTQQFSFPPVTNTQQLSPNRFVWNENKTTSPPPSTLSATNNTQQLSSNRFIWNENKTTSPPLSTLPATNNTQQFSFPSLFTLPTSNTWQSSSNQFFSNENETTAPPPSTLPATNMQQPSPGPFFLNKNNTSPPPPSTLLSPGFSPFSNGSLSSAAAESSFKFPTTPLQNLSNVQTSQNCQATEKQPPNQSIFQPTKSNMQACPHLFGGSRLVAYVMTPSPLELHMKFESISAMPVYSDKSHEELRWEDYRLSGKGKGQEIVASGSSIMFGQPPWTPQVMAFPVMPNLNFGGFPTSSTWTQASGQSAAPQFGITPPPAFASQPIQLVGLLPFVCVPISGQSFYPSPSTNPVIPSVSQFGNMFLAP